MVENVAGRKSRGDLMPRVFPRDFRDFLYRFFAIFAFSRDIKSLRLFFAKVRDFARIFLPATFSTIKVLFTENRTSGERLVPFDFSPRTREEGKLENL